ncbi:MAG: prepilin-type N-terminal cleavage/methylation domain-containing protein [Gammaproteobacteria bacterium]|nr:prepilin-type N-terminal cleavage/methylation domain-containing protein [Gammaproteobacteria bacterium]
MKARGFSLLEFVVVIVIIAILSGVLLNRVLPLIGQAERVAFMQTRQQLQSALLLEAAERVVRGESATLSELAGSNPMQLMLEPPANYVGLHPIGSHESAPRRSWYFDEREGLLVYRPGRQARFEALEGPDDRIELSVQFVFEDRDGDGRFSASADDFDGLKLESVYAYQWPD